MYIYTFAYIDTYLLWVRKPNRSTQGQDGISMQRTPVPPESLPIASDKALVSKEIMVQLHQ